MNDSVERAVADFLNVTEIDWEKLKPIMYFVVLWNRLEEKCGCFLRLEGLKRKGVQTAQSTTFDITKDDPHIEFFKKR